MRKSYTDHNAYILAKVPKDRLLEFHPRDGWEPLCAFLGHDVPEGTEFPNVNDAKSTVRLHYFIVGVTAWHFYAKYVGVGEVGERG